MVTIQTSTKKLYNSAGELATGFVLLRLPAELETTDGLMLTTRGRWVVKNGEFVDGDTKTLPAGAEVEIVHVFNVEDDSGRGVRKDRTTRWVEVPAGTTLEYVDLITDYVTVPPAVGPGVPSWAQELLDAIGDMETLNDAAMTAIAADEDSAFYAQQSATFGSWVSVKSFGAVGDGTTDDTSAFNAAIAYANSLNPGVVGANNVVGVTLFVPVGRYKITGQLTAFRKSGINLRGAGPDGSVLLLSYNGQALRFGDGTSDLLVGGSVSSLKIEYTSTPGGSATVFGVQYASRIVFNDLMLVNVATFIDAGPSSGRFASALSLSNIRGYVNNSGRPFVRIQHGAGLYCQAVQMFVGGVGAPVIDRTSTMMTIPGTDAIRAGEGSWDSIQLTGCFFERFDRGLHITAVSGAIVNNVFVTNTYFDYIKMQPIFLNSESGAVGIYGVRVANTWLASWEEAAFQIAGSGVTRGVTLMGGQIASAGTHGVNISGNPRDVRVSGVDIQGVNRTNVNGMGVAVAGGSHIQIVNIVAGHDSTWAGFPWQAYNGIYVVADLDHYTITGCDLAGTAGGITLEPHSAGSVNRIVRNNRGIAYSGYQSLSAPANDVVVTNTTGTAWDIHIHGGTVTAIQKNGQTITGMTSGHLYVGPGETFRITHSSAPTVSRFVQP